MKNHLQQNNKRAIQSLDELTEKQKDNIVFSIMNYQPKTYVRDKILEEVFQFKWLDCEKSGVNIYGELHFEDQLIAAGFEWRRKHWQDFFQTNDTDGKDQPKKIVNII